MRIKDTLVEYHEADKRSIANKIQIHFVMMEVLPMKSKLSILLDIKEEGRKVSQFLNKKFLRNLEITYDSKEKCSKKSIHFVLNQQELEKYLGCNRFPRTTNGKKDNNF